MDRQHRELLRRYDEFIASIRSGKGREAVGRTIEFLASYIDEHFAAEEALMASIAYPRRETHAEEHRKFRATFAAARLRHESSSTKLAITVALQRSLGEWIRKHVLEEDQLIAGYVRAGVARREKGDRGRERPAA